MMISNVGDNSDETKYKYTISLVFDFSYVWYIFIKGL